MYLDISCCFCSSDEELDQGEGKLVSVWFMSHTKAIFHSHLMRFTNLFFFFFGCMAKYWCLYSDDDYKIVN